MSAPWIFAEARHFLSTGELLPPPTLEAQWAHIRRHCALAVERRMRGDETHTIHAMRSRLMAYSRGMPDAKWLRSRFSHVSSLMELDAIAAENIACAEAAPVAEETNGAPDMRIAVATS
jgi:tRNA-dihydrouridine synthase B